MRWRDAHVFETVDGGRGAEAVRQQPLQLQPQRAVAQLQLALAVGCKLEGAHGGVALLPQLAARHVLAHLTNVTNYKIISDNPFTTFAHQLMFCHARTIRQRLAAVLGVGAAAHPGRRRALALHVLDEVGNVYLSAAVAAD